MMKTAAINLPYHRQLLVVFSESRIQQPHANGKRKIRQWCWVPQCAGEAPYACDAASARDVHLALVLSTRVRADIVSIDADDALVSPGPLLLKNMSYITETRVTFTITRTYLLNFFTTIYLLNNQPCYRYSARSSRVPENLVSRVPLDRHPQYINFCRHVVTPPPANTAQVAFRNSIAACELLVQ